MKYKSKYKKTMLIFPAAILLLSLGMTLHGKDSKEFPDEQYKKALEILGDVPGITNFAASEFLGIRNANPAINTEEKIKDHLNNGIQILETLLDEGHEPKGIYYMLGAAYVRLLDREEAIKYFTKAIEEEPSRETAYMNLLQLLWDKNDADAAHELLAKYSANFPAKKFEYHFYKSATYQRSKDYTNAISEAEQALKINPKAADAKFALGAAYLYKGNVAKADEQFAQAVKFAPELEAQIEEFKSNWKKKQGI